MGGFDKNVGMETLQAAVGLGGRSDGDGRPVLAITIGDVAGVGPEIVARAWTDGRLHELCRPVVVGDLAVMKRECTAYGGAVSVEEAGADGAFASSMHVMPCVQGSASDVAELPLGLMHPAAGRAAFDYLVTAIRMAQAESVDGIVTMPLNKQGFHAYGLPYPGHTEVLADKTGVKNYGMMLYRQGLGVVHVTLHMALRDVFANLSVEAILEKIGLVGDMMRRLGIAKPRLAVAALNPHAGDGGVFGDEECKIIEPAVNVARRDGIDVVGPLPADTLFVRAKNGEFDGVVAMYHDQGHIALKLLGWHEAVNITVGLPIVRTSVAHGTAYDIAGQGRADLASFFEAVRVAAILASSRRPA